MITHAATLDIFARLLHMVTTVINRARRGPGRLPRTRAATARTQAVLVIRYLRDALPIWRLARDADVSIATGYRYLHEGLDALAGQAPTLIEAIQQAIDEDDMHLLCLDGTLVPTDRVDARKPDGRHLFYSGKHKAFGVNVQVIATADGDPLWTSPGSPGSVHDTRAAREQVMDELAPFVSRHTRTDGTRRLTVLADKGYTCLDVSILTPTKRRKGVHPHVDEQTRNALLVGTRAVAERANAALVMRWHALRRVTLDPAVVGVIASAALVLTRFESSLLSLPSKASSLAMDSISDELWALVEPLLPPRRQAVHGRTGRPRRGDRATLDGIVYLLRTGTGTGTGWAKLPTELGYGSGWTCWRRLRERQDVGVWEDFHRHRGRHQLVAA